MLTIKEISEQLGITPNALRFYEKKGLLAPKRTDNNYRIYSTEDLTRLEMLLLYRKMGFSIDEIRTLLAQNQNRLEQFVTQYTALNYHIHSMIRIRETLGDCIEKMLNNEMPEDEMLEQLSRTANIVALAGNWTDQWNFDTLASNYDTFIRESADGLDFYKNYDSVLQKTASQVHGGIVVEIGIGTGNLAKKILDSNNQVVQYIGIDQSINMLKEAKKKCPTVLLRKGDFLNLPLEANSCDVIVSSYAFHHCNSREKELAIAEMDRVLKQHATIVITDLMFENQAARDCFQATCNEKERLDLEDEYFGNVNDVMRILTALGYQCRAEQIDELIWMLTANK
ncbi:MAG: MerR family transcriptional regulator [Lachnospiraceae bacterium]|nr:MerR family transcriptional regulator [Lachnospiraceae bacterium]